MATLQLATDLASAIRNGALLGTPITVPTDVHKASLISVLLCELNSVGHEDGSHYMAHANADGKDGKGGTFYVTVTAYNPSLDSSRCVRPTAPPAEMRPARLTASPVVAPTRLTATPSAPPADMRPSASRVEGETKADVSDARLRGDRHDDSVAELIDTLVGQVLTYQQRNAFLEQQRAEAERQLEEERRRNAFLKQQRAEAERQLEEERRRNVSLEQQLASVTLAASLAVSP
jgi:hypothetical protein